MASSLPSGTVTFLFTDIEGSASLAQQSPAAMPAILARHHAILRSAIESYRGIVFQITGDAFCAAFDTVGDAIQAALDGQHALERERWAVAPVKVRMGIHTGTAQALREAPDSVTYAGYLTLAHTQRIMSAAHGGQILLSNASADLMREELQGNAALRDLGEHRLKSMPNPEHIWQLVSPGLREDFPPPRALDEIPSNLPAQLSSFIGREREIAEVRQLLESHRLVTLTGPGGTGKTRLSLQVAADVLDRFKHGVWFIELAPLSDPALVMNTVASALGVREEQSRPVSATLLDWLAGRELLLVLDNCEHLIEPCARFAEAALRVSEGCRILASSREALSITGEQAYVVPSLECPTPEQAPQIPVKDLVQYPAIRLFADRAREAVATFHISLSNASAVVQICHRLDGMPLALELAAARIRLLQVEQIAERLDDRFRLLTSGGRTTLPRHQTLRSLIDWSYDLLTEPEQVLLRRLSVFAGGWSLRAAEQVCAGDGIDASDVLELLGRLVDKSLVVSSKGVRESRYHMLETIREYARERLQESAEADTYRNCHLEYFMELAEAAEPGLHGPEYRTWFDCLEMERDNWRAALESSKGHQQAELGLRLAGALYPFWELRGYWSEGYEATAGLLEETKGQKSTIRGKAAVGVGKLASDCGHSSEMSAYFEEGFEILRASGEAGRRLLGFSLSQYAVALVDRDTRHAQSVAEEGIQVSREARDILGLACSLFAMGMATRRQTNFDAARSAQEESMRLFQEMGDQQMYALLLSNLAYTHYYQGNFSDAKECFDESIRLAQEIGDKYVEANSLPGRGDLARRQGNYEEAAALLQQSLAYHRSIGAAHQGLIYDLYSLGLLQLSIGNTVQAKVYLKEGVRAVKASHLRYWLRPILDTLGYLASAKEPERAARLLGAAERLREQMGIGLFPYERDEYEKYLRLAQSQVDEAGWKAAWNEGREMTFDQSIEYALQSN